MSSCLTRTLTRSVRSIIGEPVGSNFFMFFFPCQCVFFRREKLIYFQILYVFFIICLSVLRIIKHDTLHRQVRVQFFSAVFHVSSFKILAKKYSKLKCSRQE